MKSTVKNLEALREAMRETRVDAVIIPGTDAHQSEYVCKHWKIRDWVTGFTGSNGTAVVTMKEGKLWTDSRYFLQAGEQLKDSGFELMKEDIPGEPTIEEWLAENLEEGSVLAVDGTLFSLVKANQLENFCARQGLMFATDFAPFDKIWEDRPARPQGKLFIHEEKFAGESVASKLDRILAEVESRGADAMFISALDEIAWMLNVRCDDVECTPVAIAHAYISKEKKVLFVDETKVDDEVRAFLKGYGVEVRAYDDVQNFLEKLSSHEVVLLDPNKVSDTLGNAMPCGKAFDASPILNLKAVKNETQINGVRKAMTRDGVALVKTFKWLEENVASGKITEMDVAAKAIEMRKLGDYYVTESFGMIAGYADHGAIVHYSATPETNATLKPENLLLCDTGAQYLDGTTDITRTWCLGTPTADEIHDCTLVLKGHIAIATQIFPIGTRGSQLDALARQFMWKEHVTYYHGTGHGVGQIGRAHV